MIWFRRIFYLILSITISGIVYLYTYSEINQSDTIEKLKKERADYIRKNKISKKELSNIKERIKELNKKNLNNLRYIILKKDVDLIKNIFANIIRYSNKINLFKINNLRIEKDKKYINVIKISFDLKSSYKLLTQKEAVNLFVEMINEYIKVENLRVNGNHVSFYVTKSTIKDIKI